MNTERFKTLVEALEALPDHIKNNRVDMSSLQNPVCGTPGCFAGLISIVANDIPELKGLYKLGDDYSYEFWAKATGDYLECNLNLDWRLGVLSSFEAWAVEHPAVWGNVHGSSIFSSACAYDGDIEDKLTHNEIIIYLRGVYERWVEFLKQK